MEEVEINNYRGSSTLCSKCIKPSSDNVKDPHYFILLVYIKEMYTDFFKMDEELSPRIHTCDPIIIRTKKQVDEIFTFYNIFNEKGPFDTSALLKKNSRLVYKVT